MQGQDNVTYRDNVKQDALQTKHMTLGYHLQAACSNRLNKHCDFVWTWAELLFISNELIVSFGSGASVVRANL